MKSRTLNLPKIERHEYFCNAVTPSSDVEFGKNLVRSSRQSATGANRRFQLQKCGLTPSPNSNRHITVHSFLALRKRQCWRTATARAQPRYKPHSEIRNPKSDIRHQTSDGCAFDDDLADFESNMKIDTLHIGMKVRHPQYGVGVVRSLTEQTAEIAFDDAPRTIAPASSDLQPAEATATLSELQMPLANLIRDTAHAVVEALGLEQKDVLVEGLATRWQRGTLVMQPADSSLQPKEVPLETFFHKIVMIRNNLRVLEQKVNASDKLSDADKFDLQQYITRCYGSLTTFNILFKNKDDQFRTSA